MSGSGRMALLAIHAAAKGKFFEMNDLLFAKAASGESIELSEIAGETGIDVRELQAALNYAALPAPAVGGHPPWDETRRLWGLPVIVINGNVYEGSIPAEILKSVIE